MFGLGQKMMRSICVLVLVAVKVGAATQGDNQAVPARLPYNIVHTPQQYHIPVPYWLRSKSPEQLYLPKGHPNRSILDSFFAAVNSAYQDLVNRQQAFINLINCGSCVTSGWGGSSSSMTGPNLNWLFRPNSPGTQGSFFAATNHNGMVSGVGGSIADGKPVVEFSFGNGGIQVQPSKQNSSA